MLSIGVNLDCFANLVYLNIFSNRCPVSVSIQNIFGLACKWRCSNRPILRVLGLAKQNFPHNSFDCMLIEPVFNCRHLNQFVCGMHSSSTEGSESVGEGSRDSTLSESLVVWRNRLSCKLIFLRQALMNILIVYLLITQMYVLISHTFWLNWTEGILQSENLILPYLP